jgi:chorismate mutase
MTGRLITFQFRLLDEPGVLSAILTDFAKYQANLMTVNSTIPTNGVALVTISAETTRMTVPLEELLRSFTQIPGVVKAEVMAG